MDEVPKSKDWKHTIPKGKLGSTLLDIGLSDIFLDLSP